MIARNGAALLLMLLSANTNAADMEYSINDESGAVEAPSALDDALMSWTPMSVEAFGYDIRKEWRFPKESRWSCSIAISERLALLCDIQPRELPKPEVCTFGGLGFSR